jgi:hypothetical protein
VTTLKSGYAADFAIKETCKRQGPVSVCRGFQVKSRLAVLDIHYTGTEVAQDGLGVWIAARYQEGTREGVFGQTKDAAVRITGGCLEGDMWHCAKPGTAAMRDLLHWAARADGTLNELTLELAVMGKDGSWDSRYGENYHFFFDQE